MFVNPVEILVLIFWNLVILMFIFSYFSSFLIDTRCLEARCVWLNRQSEDLNLSTERCNIIYMCVCVSKDLTNVYTWKASPVQLVRFLFTTSKRRSAPSADLPFNGELQIYRLYLCCGKLDTAQLEVSQIRRGRWLDVWAPPCKPAACGLPLVVPKHLCAWWEGTLMPTRQQSQ